MTSPSSFWPLCRILPSEVILKKAIAIQARYSFRYYDSLVVASAIAGYSRVRPSCLIPSFCAAAAFVSPRFFEIPRSAHGIIGRLRPDHAPTKMKVMHGFVVQKVIHPLFVNISVPILRIFVSNNDNTIAKLA